MSENPAKRFGLWGRKGALEVGFDADFNLVDLNRSWTCKAENMHYLNKHTPFDGREFRGRIDATYIRGQLVSKNREI
jgi:dihydroorotase-like cyclic amidohydrolase